MEKQSVEIVIPIYNEETDLENSILKLFAFLKNNLSSYKWNITIADNASTDNSLNIARSLAKRFLSISVLHLDLKGRGRAVKLAWREGEADIFVYMDVDLSTDLGSLPFMLSALSNKGYDIAIGSRLLPKSKVVGRTIKREILSRIYNILIKLFFQTHFSDAQCGFKAVTKKVVSELLPHIKDNAWFFDSELLIVGEKAGYKIYEQPVYWIDNPGSTVRVLKTVYGDLSGLWRLFWERPWNNLRKK
jgi:glycosyltransferase involved in cell wall biosynthesis